MVIRRKLNGDVALSSNVALSFGKFFIRIFLLGSSKTTHCVNTPIEFSDGEELFSVFLGCQDRSHPRRKASTNLLQGKEGQIAHNNTLLEGKHVHG